ncbi:MAG: NAD(+)/NADH kinase [Ruminococcaceae bacterium]|nr:NAD(+)/NADH kinase [Oscillospiraceae bacterium]
MENIFLIASKEKDPKYACTKNAVEILTECGIGIYSDEKLAGNERFKDTVKLFDGQKIDAVISIGGDGTIMRAASRAVEYDVPVLGINLGRVGYLAELEPHELSLLKYLKEDKYEIESRMLISVEDAKGNHAEALNDVVVSSSDRAQIATVNLYCDDNKVSMYRADGLILSTPTGSTAYNLAAAGPIIDPKLECIVSTPIAPHSLKAKPLVFNSNSILKIEAVKESGRGRLSVYVDGRNMTTLTDGETIRVKKSKNCAKFLRVKLGKNAFYNVLNSKMID